MEQLPQESVGKESLEEANKSSQSMGNFLMLGKEIREEETRVPLGPMWGGTEGVPEDGRHQVLRSHLCEAPGTYTVLTVGVQPAGGCCRTLPLDSWASLRT
jgi:hypothetical protein